MSTLDSNVQVTAQKFTQEPGREADTVTFFTVTTVAGSLCPTVSDSGRYRVTEDHYQRQDGMGVKFTVDAWTAAGWTKVLCYKADDHDDLPNDAEGAAIAVHKFLHHTNRM